MTAHPSSDVPDPKGQDAMPSETAARHPRAAAADANYFSLQCATKQALFPNSRGVEPQTTSSRVRKYLVKPAPVNLVLWFKRSEMPCTFHDFTNEIGRLIRFPGLTGPIWRGQWWPI
jgi:hypothetical protein